MKVGQKATVKRSLQFTNNIHYFMLAGKDVVIDRLFPDENLAYIRFGGGIYSIPIEHLQEKEKAPKRPRGVVTPDLTELNDAEKVARIQGGELTFYIVVNHEGKFFRSKGRDGYGVTWTEDVKRARVYSKIGPARACVTYFVRNNKNKYPSPKILEIGPNGRRYVL